MNIVYVEGDSTTFGMDDLEMGGWPNRIHVRTLRENKGLPIEDMTMVTNRAMPGRTLSNILRGAETNMKQVRVWADFVAAVLQAGMNEVKIFRGSTTPLVPAQRFRAEITRFCDIAYQQDCDPVLVGPPPIDTSRPYLPTFGGVVIRDELLIEYGEIMHGVANKEGIPYVDTRAVLAGTGRPLQELLGADGYHPNAPGHAAIATAVYDVLPFRVQ